MFLMPGVISPMPDPPSGPGRRRGDRRDLTRADHAALRVVDHRGRAWSGVSALVMELKVDAPFEVECHASHARLMVVLDEVGGRLQGRADPRRGVGARRFPNGMYYVPAQAPAWVYADQLQSARYVSLLLDPQALTDFFQDDHAPRLPDQPEMGFFDERILGLARIFDLECAPGGAGDPRIGDGLSLSLLSLLAERGDAPKAPPLSVSGGLTPRHFRRVTEYAAERLAEAISPAELAELVGLSPSHFCRAFKASTGMPPHAWLVDLRVRRARELLRTQKRPLAEIALATGFNDQSHFTRVFTRLVGVSPGAWRRQFHP